MQEEECVFNILCNESSDKNGGPKAVCIGSIEIAPNTWKNLLGKFDLFSLSLGYSSHTYKVYVKKGWVSNDLIIVSSIQTSECLPLLMIIFVNHISIS